MDESDFISNTRIAILGLGLMGGSLALALRGKCARLFGIDPDPETLALARRLEVVDQASATPGELLHQADLVILATPVGAILRLLDDLPDLHPGPAVVMDLGSTKTSIVEAMEKLPDRFDPIGGHPMCGKEHASLANADADLYQGAPFALTPLRRTSERARLLAEALALASGAKPLWLEPVIHDRWVAATSHLPYLIANTLAAVIPQQAAPMIGPGLRSTTRLAPSSIEMMLDILKTNRLNVLEDMRRFMDRLEAFEKALSDHDVEALADLLTKGKDNYENLITRVNGEDQDA